VAVDDEQRDLRALFERTAAEPSTFELTRMRARARELPARLERVPRRLPRWSWAPAFAAVAAVGALGLTLSHALAPGRAPSSASHPKVAPSAPVLDASGDPAARSAPASATPQRGHGFPSPDDDGDLDTLSLTPDADDDPFDLSTAEEMELLP
jgi:hypothetical protein